MRHCHSCPAPLQLLAPSIVMPMHRDNLCEVSLPSSMIMRTRLIPKVSSRIYSYKSANYSSFVKLVIMYHNPKTSFFFVPFFSYHTPTFLRESLAIEKASDYAKRTALARSSLIGTSSSTSKSPMPDSLNSDTILKSEYLLQTNNNNQTH